MEAIEDCGLWAPGFPDTDEVLQGIIDRISTQSRFMDDDAMESEDDESDFLIDGKKIHREMDFIVDVCEDYYCEIGEGVLRDGETVLSAIFRKKGEEGCGLQPYFWGERTPEGLRALLRWMRANAQQLQSKGPCKNCLRLSVIGADYCTKHCLQCVAKPWASGAWSGGSLRSVATARFR